MALYQFTSNSFPREYAGRLDRWDPADRARLAAQLDTAYFLLYGLTPDDAESVGQVPRT